MRSYKHMQRLGQWVVGLACPRTPLLPGQPRDPGLELGLGWVQCPAHYQTPCPQSMAVGRGGVHCCAWGHWYVAGGGSDVLTGITSMANPV